MKGGACAAPLAMRCGRIGRRQRLDQARHGPSTQARQGHHDHGSEARVVLGPGVDQGGDGGRSRALAERDLAESERRWRALSEASFEGVAISKQGRIVDCNQTFASWLGRTPEALVGSDGLNAFAPEEREYVTQMSQDSGATYESRMLHANGTLFPVEVRGRSATFNGEAVRIAEQARP